MSQADEPISVVLVDDEPDVADVTAAFLERETDGLTVTTATSAEEGLDCLDDGDIDCIVSDYDMPGRNGIEFLERVREEYPDHPFILYTGKGSEAVASDAISAGVTDYLQKTTGTDQYLLLANRIRSAVAGYRSKRRAARQEYINSLIRTVNRRLVGADTVPAIERTVCETLTASDAYRFAWIGKPDHDTGEIVPVASAGDAESYLEEVTVRFDDSPEGRGPGGRAVRTGEPQLVENIHEDDSFGLWREAASAHGHGSVFVLPLDHDGDGHCILTIYAEHPYAFSETERDVLVELSETVSEALDAARTKGRLRERERELRRKSRAMDAAPVGITITDPSQEDNPIIYANERFGELTGYDETEIIGRNCRFLQGDETDTEPVDEMRRSIDAGEPTTVELRNYRADGTAFWNRVSLAPVRNENGDVVNWVGFQEDRTDRTERECERRDEQAFIEQSLDALEDVFYVFDATGTIVRWNDRVREVTGYSEAELDGMAVTDFFPEDHVDRIADGVQEVLETGDAKVRADYLTADGDRIPYEFTGQRLTDAEGNVVGFTGVGRDVTDRLAYERQLERRNEHLDEFASIVSHDLRNPLNVATARLELADDECDSDHLDAVAEAHEHMEELIEQLLTVAQEGEVVTDLQTVSLPQVVEASWESVETNAATLAVETDLELLADEGRLRQLLENLMRNAVDHYDGDTEWGPDALTVEVGDLPDDSGFYVADDGPGVPVEERGDVFDRGFTTAEDGIGVGLSVVKRIANAHGWEVDVTESDDGGARFEIHTGD